MLAVALRLQPRCGARTGYVSENSAVSTYVTVNPERPITTQPTPKLARHSALENWGWRLTLLVVLGLFTWTWLHRAPARGPRKPAPLTPAQQLPSAKPRLTLEPELLS